MMTSVAHLVRAALATLALAWTAASAADLELRAECRPAGPVVTLGDVAEVVADDPEQARLLAAIELFPSPPPGQSRFVGIRQIQDLLLLREVNLVEHRFSGSSRVTISRTEAAPLQPATPRDASPHDTQAMVVAARVLPRGAVIGPGDVRLERPNAEDRPVDGFGSIEKVVGHQTTRGIAAGKPLSATSVRPPILVRRGEVVTVYVRSPGIRVRSVARARDDGSLGDLIALESFEDRKTLLARVSGMQEVEIYGRAVRSTPAATDFTLSTDGDAAGN
jgi:flagella basal body P-ring formation protein FlgA